MATEAAGAAARVPLGRIAAGSVAVSLVVLGIKYQAYALTGSVALLSDAIESIINVVTAGMALIAVRISAIPADEDHPYGHAKAEYLSAVVEGVMILVAALAILREAWLGFAHPRPLAAPALGIAVNLLATVINAGWSWVLLRIGRARRSPALVADGRHLLTDVWTSGGVIVGVLLVALSGWLVLDSLLAALVALHILWSGGQLVRESVDGLMDKALPEDQLARIEKVIADNLGTAIEAHGLRSRCAGATIFIDFHLIVDRRMTVDASHAICDRIEAALHRLHPDCLISIHVEPDFEQRGGPMRMVG